PRHLENGIPQKERGEDQTHLLLRNGQVMLDSLADAHDADAVEIGHQRQGAGKTENAEAHVSRAIGDRGGGRFWHGEILPEITRAGSSKSNDELKTENGE